MNRRADQELVRLQAVKGGAPPVGAELGPVMIDFFKQSVSRRQTKLGKLAECWGQLIPSTLVDHCSLESLSRGSLTVIVDSSSHLHELRQVLLAGLEKQIMIACKSAGLRKIVLKPGRWYEGDPAERKVRFPR
jgi:hypothetical protein